MPEISIASFSSSGIMPSEARDYGSAETENYRVGGG